MNKKKILIWVIPLTMFAIVTILLLAGLNETFENWAYEIVSRHMSPAMNKVATFITRRGDTISVVLICLALIIIPASRKTIALPVISAVIASTVINNLLKVVFMRERPDVLRLVNETGYSFPSGHSMVSATLYTMFAFLAYRHLKNKYLKVTISALCVIMFISIGITRIYLGVHYAFDVLGGWFFGFAIAAFVFGIHIDKTSKKAG